MKQHFDTLQDRLVCFREKEVQVEGWFKGEMLFLLTNLLRKGIVESFGREVGPGGKVDLVIKMPGLRHWIELKHWLVGVQRGARLAPAFYFGDRTSVGVVQGVDKLSRVESEDGKWLLILMTGNPGNDLWQRGLARFHCKFAPRVLIPRSQPEQFPDSYFLGLLQIEARRTAGD
jgi:hypothetical protein